MGKRTKQTFLKKIRIANKYVKDVQHPKQAGKYKSKPYLRVYLTSVFIIEK